MFAAVPLLQRQYSSHTKRAQPVLATAAKLVPKAVQGAIVAVEDPQRRFFGLQYHPEVQHTKRGRDMLRHFLFDVAEVPADWKMESVLEEEMAKIADLVGISQCNI